MPARKFSELLEAMPARRRQKVAERVRETIAAMPLDELRRARRMTQASLAESPGVNQGEVSKIEYRTDLLSEHPLRIHRGTRRNPGDPSGFPGQ